MDREVGLLKHSNIPQEERNYAKPEDRNYAKPEEVRQSFPMLTSTEKEVRALKEEVS